MDSIKGAQELTRLLMERHGDVPAIGPQAALEDEFARPIYHWLGIEPVKASSDSTDADATT